MVEIWRGTPHKLLRLKPASNHVSEHNQTFLISNNETICIQAVSSTSIICGMEGWSKQNSNRCNATVLEQNVSICFPLFHSDNSNSEQGPSRKGRTNDNSYTKMRNTTLVSNSVRYVEMQFPLLLLLKPLPDLLLDLQGNKHPLVQNRQIIIAAWKVTGNPLKRKEFQAMQPSLYPSQEDSGFFVSYRPASNNRNSWYVR